jgi:uncharacterized membrane protein YczE
LRSGRAWLSPALTWSRLVAGLFISAAGTVTTIRAHLGISPWDVLHDGLSRRTPLTFGEAVIAVSITVVAASWLIGIRPGTGMIANVVLIGAFDDILLRTGIGSSLVTAPLVVQVTFLALGVTLVGFGAAVYIGAGLGAGPRDSLQLALSLRAGWRPGVARACVEGFALAVGWILGGAAGLGTMVSVLMIGVAVDVSFAALRVDPAGRRRMPVAAP